MNATCESCERSQTGCERLDPQAVNNSSTPFPLACRHNTCGICLATEVPRALANGRFSYYPLAGGGEMWAVPFGSSDKPTCTAEDYVLNHNDAGGNHIIQLFTRKRGYLESRYGLAGNTRVISAEGRIYSRDLYGQFRYTGITASV